MADATLPQNWHQLLERFTGALTHIQLTLERASALESTGTAPLDTPSYTVQLDEHAQRTHTLSNKAAAINAWVDNIETELRASEDLLRVLLTQTEAVRHKLATWTGRAIG